MLENEKLTTLSAAQQARFDFLRAAPNVVLAPHIGGWSFQSYERINAMLARKLGAFLGR